MKKFFVLLCVISVFVGAGEIKNMNGNQNQSDNSTVKTKSVGHVGGFAVSGRVSTIIDKNSTNDKEIKEIKSNKDK